MLHMQDNEEKTGLEQTTVTVSDVHGHYIVFLYILNA